MTDDKRYSVWTHDNSSDFFARNAGLSQRRLSPGMSAPDAYSLLTHLAAVYGDGVYADTDLHIRDWQNRIFSAADFHNCDHDHTPGQPRAYRCHWHGQLKTLMQADPVTVTVTLATAADLPALRVFLRAEEISDTDSLTITSTVTGLTRPV